MYLLQSLQAKQDESNGVQVEYRLACSGELFNRKVITSDWRKSDITRILVTHPISVFVVSRPFDSYPQELCVRLYLNRVTETSGHFSRNFLPDAEVIEDVCAIMTLLSRRLITVVTKTREKLSDERAAHTHDYFSDVPTPLLNRSEVVTWPRRPATIITSSAGQEFRSNDPSPIGVDPDALAGFLARLPAVANAQEVIYAARLYKLALELLVDRPDMAYLMLVSVVESLANVALKDFDPTEVEKLQNKASVIKRARDFGLNEEQARSIALEATKGDRWLTKRFLKFCIDNCPANALAEPDDLFILLEQWNPPTIEFATALARIYRARSTNLHVAAPFPPGIGMGMGPQIKITDMPLDWTKGPAIPPVGWFERVVSIAALNFLLPEEPKPFIPCT